MSSPSPRLPPRDARSIRGRAPLLIAALRRLSELGVVVVAGANNDGSNVEFFPAAFAATGLPGAPMVSVGARTTSEHEVAIWSNTGSWVMAYGAGASVVSTMPTTFNGSRRGELANPAAPGQPARGTGDSDDFSGGFRGLERHVVLDARPGQRDRSGLGHRSGRPDRRDRVKRAQKAVAAVLRTRRERPTGTWGRSPRLRSRHTAAVTPLMAEMVERVSPCSGGWRARQGLSTASAEDVVQTSWLRLLHIDRIDEDRAVLRSGS